LVVPGWLDPLAQAELAASARRWIADAGGLHSPVMPTGGTMSVGMACLGWQWFPYGYRRTLDREGRLPVAPFPAELGELGRRAVADATGDADAAERYGPDVAIINHYGPGARMGMHVDRDERDPAPVVSISVGDTCTFRFGTPATRNRPWTDVVVESGDLVVFGGASRLAYHGVPKVLAGTGPPGLGITGRINLTLRRTGLS
jgi:alkylated DNA repair protein (DNA oxidative demethylase)